MNNNELIFPVQTFMIQRKCSKCGEGIMQFRPSKLAVAAGSAKYTHVCTRCGAVEALEKQYPMITYAPVQTNTNSKTHSKKEKENEN